MSIIEVVNKLITTIKPVSISVAILAIILHAFKFFKGDGHGKAEAKEAIFWAIVALIIIFSAEHLIEVLRTDMGW
ncbi:MAG: hypothetical protein GX046_05850 [Tissierellia bacterium]|jgi:type IV secretory pathway VirB2 component (pilin)|nr:hypothetical protein [Tissierellia bacterium]